MKLYRLIIIICILPVMELIAQQPSIKIQWEIAGQVTTLGLGGPVAGVYDHLLFIGGGSNFPVGPPWEGGTKKYYSQLSVFKREGEKLIALPITTSLPTEIAYPATCTTPKGIFYGGGENATGLTSLAFLMSWDTKTQTPKIESLPFLPEPITTATATAIGDKIFLAGGDTKSGTSKKVWCLNLAQLSTGWTAVADLPHAASYSIFLTDLTTRKLLLIGGRSKTNSGISELLKTVFEFDIAQNRWKPLTELPYYLSAGTGVMLEGGDFILFGGERGTTFSQVERLQQSIATATDSAQRKKFVDQKNNLLIHHPGFSRELLRYDKKSKAFEVIGVLPFDTPVTTIACWWGDHIYIPSGEIKAGVRSPNILSAKIEQ